MSARPILAAFVGPSSFPSTDEPCVIRAVEALPEGSILLALGVAGVEKFACEVARRSGVHVATVSGPAGCCEADLVEAMFRLGVGRVYAHRQGGAETALMVGYAEGMGADVRNVGLGEGCEWANLPRTRAKVAMTKRNGERPLVVLVSGSRDWRDIKQVYRDLSALPKGSVVVHGEARGLDRIAAGVARVLGLMVVGVPPLWDFFGAPGRKGNPAGFRRNEAMARFDPIFLHAYPLDGPGTQGMIDHAEKCCIQVREGQPHSPVTGPGWASVAHWESDTYLNASNARYIGRGRDPLTQEFGKWGNRYSHRASRVPGVVRVATPEEAVVRFWLDLVKGLRSGAVDRAELAELHGAVLGCWCREGSICHGHVLSPAAAWAAGVI